MKAADLMLGNLVAGIEDAFPPSTVIAIEPGLVHLSSRMNPDDERDIIGVPLSRLIIENIGYIHGKDYIIDFNKNKLSFSIVYSEMDLLLHYQKGKNSPLIELKFVHELQNFLFVLGYRENEFIRKII